MADAKLGILISADVGQAQSGLTQLNNSLNKTADQFKIVSIGSDKLGLTLTTLTQKVALFGGGVQRSVSPVPAIFQRIAPAANQATVAVNKFGSSSNAAMQASVNFGRVIQDAPFGFLGIANNLNPLLESFERLKVQTGSTSGAMKALGASMMGPAGLGLAVSLVSTGLILFGDRLFSTTGGINLTEAATNKFKAALKDLGQEVDDIKDRMDFSATLQKLRFQLANGPGAAANIFGLELDAKNADRFITEIDKRIDQLGTTVLKFKPQVDALNQAVQTVPDKFLTKGQILLKTYGDLNKIPAEALDKLGSGEGSFIKKYQESTKTLEDLEKKRSDAVRLISTNRLKTQLEQSEEAKRILEKSKADYEKYVNETISEAQRLFNALKGGIDLDLDFRLFDTVGDKFKKSLSFLSKLNAGQFKFTIELPVDIKNIEFPTPEKVVQDNRSDTQRMADMFGKDFGEYFKPNLDFDKSLILAVQNANVVTAAEKLSKDTADAFNNGLQNISASGFDSLGEAFGEILSGGDIQNAFQQFGNTIGSALQAMGKQIIAIGVAAILAKEALKKLFANPFVAVAAGIALVAAGTAFKNILGGGLKGARAKGGPVMPDGSYLVGEEGPEFFRPDRPGTIITASRTKKLLSGFGGFREAGGAVSSGLSYLVGEKGRELFMPRLNYALQGNMGAIQPVQSGGSERLVTEISGNVLRLLLQRTNNQQGRLT